MRRTASHAATTPPAVVHRALADVPRVDVSAEHHDFVGLLAPAQLGDDVARRRVGQHLRAHLSVTMIFSPRFCMRCSIFASSTLSAAAGIFDDASMS